jgi:hypothetical protein
MARRLRRDVRRRWACATLSSLALVRLALSACRQGPAVQPIGELTVQRLHVTDANRTLRLAVGGKDRRPPGAIDRKTIDRAKPDAGFTSSNDAGDLRSSACPCVHRADRSRS